MVKVTLNFNEEIFKAAESIALRYNMNMTTVINHAVALEDKLRKMQEQGGTLMLIKANGDKEIITVR